MSVSKTRGILYQLARWLGDYQAIASGNPKKMAKRFVNKQMGRHVVGRMWFK